MFFCGGKVHTYKETRCLSIQRLLVALSLNPMHRAAQCALDTLTMGKVRAVWLQSRVTYVISQRKATPQSLIRVCLCEE